MSTVILIIIIVVILIVLLSSMFKVIRPTERGLVERFGKYSRFANPGLNIILPLRIERVVVVNITEQMVSSEKREIITADSLNAVVDSNIYYKVKPDETSVKSSIYGVNDYTTQIVALAKTTLRNIIGTMSLKQANSDRNKINMALFEMLSKETAHWGIEIVRTELKEIVPPKDVQEQMNEVVIAENKKIAAKDFAEATEMEADGKRRAAIKMAEGEKQSAILTAEGRAEAIKLVNDAANKYFIGNAQVLRKLETVETSLKSNTKVILPTGEKLVNVIGSLGGIEDNK